MHWTKVCTFVVLLIFCTRGGLRSVKTRVLHLLGTGTPSFKLLPPSALTWCTSLKSEAGHPEDFQRRSRSDRFVVGTKPVLIKGARVWTGERNGTEIVTGDVLLNKGIIQGVGRSATAALATHTGDIIVIDAKGAWITPGLIDIRSHHGILSSPQLGGTSDAISSRGTVQPWLRSVDALNTHDNGYLLSIAGGTTTALVLPASTNAIGGEGYVVKLRDTLERSPTSMLLEPALPSRERAIDGHSKWRYIIHACGENPDEAYNTTRMDNMWALRSAYIQAREAVQRQDGYCTDAALGNWTILNDAPQNYGLELLSEVLRGKAKVHVHCDEAVDLDNIVRLSQEFQFPIAAIHSASDAYLVPEMLRQAYGMLAHILPPGFLLLFTGKPPALALSVTNGRRRREQFRASEFAPKILAQEGFTVSMQSHHPQGIDARYLMYEAQKSFFYGLPPNLAIASVTSKPAEIMGMEHRIGYIKQGWDADLVIWDSHPLALGATPSQVIIDGIPQLSGQAVYKPDRFQKLPEVPNFDKEVKETLAYDGLPPLRPQRLPKTVMFTNVSSIYNATVLGVEKVLAATHEGPLVAVVSTSGKFSCFGPYGSCSSPSVLAEASVIDLRGGSIAPAFIAFGSPLGLQEIGLEMSTSDGYVFDPLHKPVPQVLGGDTSVVHAFDGIEFGTRDALMAYRVGVTSAISAPIHKGFLAGLSTHFSTGSMHQMERGSIQKDVVALHVSIRRLPNTSVSTQIAALRRLLFKPSKSAIGSRFSQILEGSLPLVIEAHSADVIATLIILKKEVELRNKKSIRMIITGAAEAHLLARELAEAQIGIILTPSRPSPKCWEERRILPGPPLTPESAIATLLSHNVVVGIGIEENASARDLPFDIAWAAIEKGGKFSREDALALGSTNIARLLGIDLGEGDLDLVVTRDGDLLDFGSQVIGVISAKRELVHLTV